MTSETTQNIENQLFTLKNNLEFAQNSEIVINSFLNKDKFKFDFIMNENNFGKSLFENCLFSCGSISFAISDIKAFESRFKAMAGISIQNKEWLKTIKSMKFICKNISENNNNSIFHQIAGELIK